MIIKSRVAYDLQCMLVLSRFKSRKKYPFASGRFQFSFRERARKRKREKERRRFVDPLQRNGSGGSSLSLSLPRYPLISVHADVTSAVTPRYIIGERPSWKLHVLSQQPQVRRTWSLRGHTRARTINDHFQRLSVADGCWPRDERTWRSAREKEGGTTSRG